MNGLKKSSILSKVLSSLLPALPLFGYTNISEIKPSKEIYSLAQFLSPKESKEIARRIWKNECGNKIENLTFWSPYEDFPSLGIGHFIWLPKDCKSPFQETFPELLAFLKKRKAKLPSWLYKTKNCPWKTRKQFYKKFQSKKMQELRRFLYENPSEQAIFMINRLENALEKITKNLSEEEKKHVCKQFYRIAKEPLGVYALTDYVNFKGEGASSLESYNGHNWGLLQVLLNMEISEKAPPLEAFSKSAKTILIQRVQNAPPRKNEKRWIQGWLNRVDTYKQAF